jgi:hypothetical protein
MCVRFLWCCLVSSCKINVVPVNYSLLNKVVAKGSCKDGVWGLNGLDCDNVVNGSSFVGDGGRRRGIGILIGSRWIVIKPLKWTVVFLKGFFVWPTSPQKWMV